MFATLILLDLAIEPSAVENVFLHLRCLGLVLSPLQFTKTDWRFSETVGSVMYL